MPYKFVCSLPNNYHVSLLNRQVQNNLLTTKIEVFFFLLSRLFRFYQKPNSFVKHQILHIKMNINVQVMVSE